MVFGVLSEDSLKPGPSLKPRVAPNPILGIGTSRERERERERERGDRWQREAENR